MTQSMNPLPPLYIEAPAFWSPRLPGWAAARAAFRGEGALGDPPARRPTPQLLESAERRRVPDSVALALEVASAAVARSGRDAADLPCIFCSAHGDLAISDYMCATLRDAPTQMSPTKFHNSVHNAAAGYWTIGSGCQQASNSLSAFNHSFASGLLEAVAQVVCDQTPLLLVSFEIEANGPLRQIHPHEQMMACALVLATAPSNHSVARLECTLEPGPAPTLALHSDAARSLAGGVQTDALPLFEVLARDVHASLALPLSSALSLRLQLSPTH